MTQDELEQKLRSQFDLKLICDLGEISNSPNALFKTLNDVYQDKYEPNDRIVFYTSHAVPEQLLKHLYETANFLDISNWFILICGSLDIEQSIVQLCEKFSNDPVPFSFYSVDLVPATQKLENSLNPNSAIVGTSGSELARVGPDTAKARTRFSAMRGVDVETVSNVKESCPPNKSTSAGALPL